jgi:hypothetical protein
MAAPMTRAARRLDKNPFVSQAESQPQRRAGRHHGNDHGQPHNAAIPDNAAIQHQGSHTDIVHRYACAQDSRGAIGRNEERFSRRQYQGPWSTQ